MHLKSELKIKRRTFPEWLTLFVFVMPFLLPTMLQLLNAPGLLKYTLDVAWVLLLLFLVLRRHLRYDGKKGVLPVFVLLLFLYSLIVYLCNYQSPFYFLWGVRNNFRFYVAFFAYAAFFSDSDVETAFGFLDLLFYVNILVTAFQYAVLGLRGDFLGGIFGVETGSNSGTLLFFTIVLAHSFLNYMEGRVNAPNVWLKCAVSLVIAALAELKFFFLVFVAIVLLAMLFTRFSFRKLLLIAVSAGILMVSTTLLSSMFVFDWTWESIVEVITKDNYSSARDLGRYTAIPRIAETILTDLPSRLFGMGLGNCDTSAFEICNKPFFKTHYYLNYDWFSSAFLFLETGFIGLGLNLMFYVICFIMAHRQYKRGEGNRFYCQMAMIAAVICIALTFYNSSLRTEVAYMIYFVLALPFISKSSVAEIGEKV